MAQIKGNNLETSATQFERQMSAAGGGFQDSTGDRRDPIQKGGDDPRRVDRQIAVVFNTLMPRRRDVGVALWRSPLRKPGRKLHGAFR